MNLASFPPGPFSARWANLYGRAVCGHFAPSLMLLRLNACCSSYSSSVVLATYF